MPGRRHSRAAPARSRAAQGRVPSPEVLERRLEVFAAAGPGALGDASVWGREESYLAPPPQTPHTESRVACHPREAREQEEATPTLSGDDTNSRHRGA